MIGNLQLFFFAFLMSDGGTYGLPAGYTEKSGGRGSSDAVAVEKGDSFIQ